MEVAQRLLEILRIYKDNSELVSSAVKDIQQLRTEGQSRLRRGLEERKRKLILKDQITRLESELIPDLNA